MMKFVNWLRSSFEGKDGRSSGRAIAAFFLLNLAGYMIVREQIPAEHRLRAFQSLLVASAVFFGLVTAQHIIEFKNGKKPDE